MRESDLQYCAGIRTIPIRLVSIWQEVREVCQTSAEECHKVLSMDTEHHASLHCVGYSIQSTSAINDHREKNSLLYDCTALKAAVNLDLRSLGYTYMANNEHGQRAA